MAGRDEREVALELFLLMHRNLVSNAIGQSVLSGLVFWAALGVTPTKTLLIWLAYMYVIAGLYIWQYFEYRDVAQKAVQQTGNLGHWKLYRNLVQWFSAMGWGSIGFLMVPDATIHNVLLMTVLTGVMGQAAMSNASNDMVGNAISLTSAVFLGSVNLPTAFGTSTAQITTMLIFYNAVLLVNMRNAHNAMRTSVRLRLANAALARTNADSAARAEKANREKSEFLAAASHDLRQPVHALLLLIEAYRQSDSEVASHPLVRQIAAAGQSINGLFNALMELSRLESGTEKPNSINLNLTSVIQLAVDNARPQGELKRLSIRLFVSRDLLKTTICTDKVLLERILGNLLSNAIRYTPSGGVLVSLRGAHASDDLWLEVWDTGTGIAKENQARIFDPYVQVGNRERDRSKGLGLGLAIVRHATELLGMKLTLTSRIGQGSRFRLHIPFSLVQQDAMASIPATLSEFLPCTDAVLHSRRILVIDDDPMVLKAMQALLRGWQMDLRCDSGGNDSLLLQRDPLWSPECIISDFRLPGPFNGIQLLDALLDQYPDAVGILQTGEVGKDVHAQAAAAGYLVLSKPVAASTLASTLGAVLERRSMERVN